MTDQAAWERHVAARGERILPCGRCATENGVEVHPHPECPATCTPEDS